MDTEVTVEDVRGRETVMTQKRSLAIEIRKDSGSERYTLVFVGIEMDIETHKSTTLEVVIDQVVLHRSWQWQLVHVEIAEDLLHTEFV